MSRIIFCATDEGMRRQAEVLSRRNGEAPRLLRADQDVLNAMLDLEVGRDVVARASTVMTGWRLPEGAEIGFDPDMYAEGLAPLRAQCEARAYRDDAAPVFEVLIGSSGIDARVRGLLSRKVRDPFGPHEISDLGPEAA
jgi:hypothetical protein